MPRRSLSDSKCWNGGKKWVKVSSIAHLKVDVPVLVHVEGAEHVVAELLRVAGREEHLVHVHELVRRQAAVGAVLLRGEESGAL